MANLTRVLVRWVLLGITMPSGAALAHNALPDVAWQDSGAERFLPASLGERWVLATNSPRRGVTPEEHAVAGAATRLALAPRPSSRPAAAQAAREIVTTSTTGPGQSGYVHYFVIEAPDGERETQIGIELPDGRIAWSFFELGVVVSPFMDSGEMQAGGQAYKVRHLYGIRPFRDDESMRVLQKDLWRRVIPWVDDETPYCALAARGNVPCLSCLGFVLRVLYPSRSGGMPALPPDFERSGTGIYFTTEDLLLYHAGLQGSRTPGERMARINSQILPQNLRDDLIRIVQSIDADDHAGGVAGVTPKRITGKKRPPARSISKAGQTRPSPLKKL